MFTYKDCLVAKSIAEKKQKITKNNLPSTPLIPEVIPFRFDELNTDPEEDEKDYVFEIDRDWTKQFFRRNYIVLKKGVNEQIVGVANHRKRVNDEGELLAVWSDGQRTWNYLSDVLADYYNGACKYIHENGFTLKQMGLGIKKKKEEEDAQIKKQEKMKKKLEAKNAKKKLSNKVKKGKIKNHKQQNKGVSAKGKYVVYFYIVCINQLTLTFFYLGKT
jgi:hypothetical protein